MKHTYKSSQELINELKHIEFDIELYRQQGQEVERNMEHWDLDNKAKKSQTVRDLSNIIINC